MATTSPTLTEIKAIVSACSNIPLQSLPIHEIFGNMGLHQEQLHRIQVRILKTFQRTVPLIKLTDTVAKLSENLNHVKP